jgi:hypothetical protein
MKLISKLAAIAAFAGIAFAFGNVPASADSYRECNGPRERCGPFVRHQPGLLPLPGHLRHHGGPRIGFEFRFGNAPYYDPYYYPRRIYRPAPIIRTARFCSNDAAVYKARSLGVRHIRAYSYHDHILIKGIKRGYPVHLAIARARGCPIIDY